MAILGERRYETTSISDLEKAAGLSRISIYNMFGDKKGKFLRVLDFFHWNATLVFEKIGKGRLEDIARFLSGSRPFSPNASNQFGCLQVNTILKIEP